MQNSEKSKLRTAIESRSVFPWGQGQRERWIANMYKETLGDDDESVLRIDYRGDFLGDASVKTCQFYKFTK